MAEGWEGGDNFKSDGNIIPTESFICRILGS